MKRSVLLPIVVLFVLSAARPAVAAPAWGGNCLSCHDQLQMDSLQVAWEDTVADPDESGTGAPDRGPLKVFQAVQGQVKTLYAEVSWLGTDDTYAVQIKRFQFPGVESGGSLQFTEDCDWPGWGQESKYFTEPVIAYQWGTGPTTFAFEIEVLPGAGVDYYDLVFALAGMTSDTGELFYAEEHFYLQVDVAPPPGDINGDGDVNLADFDIFHMCLNGPDNPTVPTGCTPEYFDACDLRDDNDVDLDDFAEFTTYFTQ
ncbi:MAG: hypothetical protein JSV78_05410 [Phycisphaerales bacterium]|nr:MAG: hypothetical protein JSV78_05410 [Phycisphaerales bacterium]